MTVTRLDPGQLYRRCDPAQFSFQNTTELPAQSRMLGQERALEALRFGIGIRREGYNLFVLGPTGTGKHRAVQEFLASQAAMRSTPPDLCYVYNFQTPYRPDLLRLPSPRGRTLRQAMEHFVEDLRSVIPAAFQTPEYQTRLQEIEEEVRERQEQALDDGRQRAERQGLTLLNTPDGFAFAPVKDGEVLNPDEFSALSQEEQSKIQERIQGLQEQLQHLVQQFPQWRRESHRRIKALNREVTAYAVGHLIDELKHTFSDLQEVCSYLDGVQLDVLENIDRLRAEAAALVENPAYLEEEGGVSLRYRVNLLVDNSNTSGAPVVYADHPLYEQLMGRLEYVTRMGALHTDFTLIQSGALQRSNGGYLIVDAARLLAQPDAWEGLKRVLSSHEVRVESAGQATGMISTVSLDPEPVVLDIKVILIGDRASYYNLCETDADFSKLFKVAVDFNGYMPRTEESQQWYARLLANLVSEDGLLPLAPDAVARVVEHSARLAGDAGRLSADLRGLADLLREADYNAREAGQSIINANSVQWSIDSQARRLDRIREQHYEQIHNGSILIDTRGSQIGVVNGLTVMEAGDYDFGMPARISATARLGEAGVVDIEREVELGGALHSKGVYILSHYLAANYCRRQPLCLTASLVFEQNYSLVDGDSASLTEIVALLSALAEVPVSQCLGITGSINQLGQVQSIGGVNEKIEGFFDICKTRGLTGNQGVVIPYSNIPQLMLRHDVVKAVNDGQFHVHAVETVNDVMELMTGFKSGERGADDEYTQGSLNARVEARLREFARLRHNFEEHGKHDSGQDGNGHDQAKQQHG